MIHNPVVGGGGSDTKKYKLTNNTSNLVVIPTMNHVVIFPGESIMVEAGEFVHCSVMAKSEAHNEVLGDIGMNLSDYSEGSAMYMPNADATLTDI